MVTFGPGNNLRFEVLHGRRDALLSKATEIGRGVFGTVYRVSVGEGRVHYNVKPSNILLDEQCNLMIGDFGLAAWRDCC
uniref:Protein kinase domain-containing protein n=1 Tax=Oryza meridionalis TaxID=40149 RepID=A0A0E0BYY8_9ORYZ